MVDDGWTTDADEEPPPLATTITAEHAKSIISRNDSPDIPFEQSINPYRGCGHGCVYCLSGDTRILLVDGRTKLLRDIKIGDPIIGTRRRGRYRRYVKTQVLAHWNTHKPAYRLVLADGTTITASADHRFLSDRGWKHVTGAQQGRNRRPYLTAGNRLMGVVGQAVESPASFEIGAIERLGKSMSMYDITTGTGDFIANGVVSHNCYARPAHSYVNLSPGLDFETKLFYKKNAAELLREELSRPHYVCKSITLGANTDPYQPIERNLKVTRSILEVLQEFRHPVSIVTKGHLIERDIDILAAMAHDNLASVLVSVTTLDPDLKRILEPRAPAAAARLRAIRSLHAAGVPVGALVAPVIPAINDHGIEHILAAVVQAGARTAGYVMLRLPYEVKDLFREWLAEHHPLRAAHVMSLVNDLRGGRDNDPNFGSRMRGTGPFAELVRRRFQVACRRLNLNTMRRVPLDTRLFRAAPPPVAQLDLGF